MCDCDAPQAFSQRHRRAAKDHRCCECGGPIARGQTYLYISGIWDRRPGSYRTCRLCEDVRSVMRLLLHRDDCEPCLGLLYDDWGYWELPLPDHVRRTTEPSQPAADFVKGA